jgi:uncharacterized protein YifE (UPF0438 family)
MKNDVVIIHSDTDWEGLFVNGEVVQEGYTLEGDYTRKQYLAYVCKRYGVTLDDIKEGTTTPAYDEILDVAGCFDPYIGDVDYDLDYAEYNGENE